MMKLYIIDDDEITLFLTRTIFELFSPESECVTFTNGNAALAQLEKDAQLGDLPSVILLDLNMPVVSGFDVLVRMEPLASRLLSANCRVFVLTSSVDGQDRLKSLGHPLVTDLIEKPFDDDKLQFILNSFQNPSLSTR
jgi:two-component system, chemotaxis family, chemotaxis protein CheY